MTPGGGRRDRDLGLTLRAGEVAVYDRPTCSIHCVLCPSAAPSPRLPRAPVEPRRTRLRPGHGRRLSPPRVRAPQGQARRAHQGSFRPASAARSCGHRRPAVDACLGDRCSRRGAVGARDARRADRRAGEVVEAVFGTPVQRGDVTVIPAARIRWGLGGGGGEDRRTMALRPVRAVVAVSLQTRSATSRSAAREPSSSRSVTPLPTRASILATALAAGIVIPRALGGSAASRARQRPGTRPAATRADPSSSRRAGRPCARNRSTPWGAITQYVPAAIGDDASRDPAGSPASRAGNSSIGMETAPGMCPASYSMRGRTSRTVTVTYVNTRPEGLASDRPGASSDRSK